MAQDHLVYWCSPCETLVMFDSFRENGGEHYDHRHEVLALSYDALRHEIKRAVWALRLQGRTHKAVQR
jgi:hypothetical protein